MRELAIQRERFFASGVLPAPGEVPATIAASWARSREFGVDPSRRLADVQPRPESPSEIGELLSRVPELLELVSAEVAACGHYCVIADHEARLKWMGGDRGLLAFAGSKNAIVDSLWQEEFVGTNGIGTALAGGELAAVNFSEHVCDGWQDVVCIGAPIHNPVTGRVAGVFDVSGVVTASPGAIMHTKLGARLLEREWHSSILSRAMILNASFSEAASAHPAVPILAFDKWGYLVRMNASAAPLVHVSPEVVSQPAPTPPNWRSGVVEAVARMSLEGPLAVPNLELAGAESSPWSISPVSSDGEIVGLLCAAQPDAQPQQPLVDVRHGDPARSPHVPRLIGLRDGRMHVLDVRMIVHAAFRDRDVVLHTKDGAYVSTYHTLSALDDVLPSPPFFLANRSDIVNLLFIDEITTDDGLIEVVLANERGRTAIPISRRRVGILRRYLHF